jgi:hypothetical protein
VRWVIRLGVLLDHTTCVTKGLSITVRFRALRNRSDYSDLNTEYTVFLHCACFLFQLLDNC